MPPSKILIWIIYDCLVAERCESCMSFRLRILEGRAPCPPESRSVPCRPLGHFFGKETGTSIPLECKTARGQERIPCSMYLKRLARPTTLERDTHLWIVFHLFNKFNKLQLCARFFSRKVNLGKEVTKVKAPHSMNFTFLGEETNKEAQQ